jgi:hypothetical protein
MNVFLTPPLYCVYKGASSFASEAKIEIDARILFCLEAKQGMICLFGKWQRSEKAKTKGK